MRSAIATLPLTCETDVVSAHQRAHLIASCLGFKRQDQNFISTAVSEIALNAFEYAGGGTLDFSIARNGDGQKLEIRISDTGPGIRDLDLILSGRYHSSGAMGLGIPGARRLVDGFHVETAPGRGTVVTLCKNLPASAPRHDRASIRRIADEIAKNDATNPLQEQRRQSQDLLLAWGELRRREQELAELNKELEDTNRGVMALYAELEDRAERLKQADQIKSRFLSHISHEVRTPLNSILALSRILLDRMDGELSPEQEKQVDLINKSANTLIELVNDLLDLSKVEAGKVEVSVSEFTVDQLFGALRGALRPLARPGIDLIFESAADVPTLSTDEGKIAQILRNLISNAIKFTEAGEIRVSVGASSGWIFFRVRDTGIGIAPEDQERIFDEFTQVKHPLQRRVKGTGLGLPISRRLAQILGGDIDVKSDLGAGSTFTLTVPRKYSASGVAPQRPCHVLVVDDDETFRYIVRQFLSGANYLIAEASDGRQALEYLREQNPDVVLLDISMPVMDGFEFLERMSVAAPKVTSSVVVMTSAVLDGLDRRRLAKSASILRKDALSKSTLLSAIARATAIVRS
jgi:signal transduction histidine kinase/CheY-like chemotaxis protein